MTNYVWKAKDRWGRKVVREVWAKSAGEAKEVLLAEGCTDVELFQDEIMAAAANQFDRNATVLGEPIEVTAEERIRQHSKPQLTLWRALWEGAWESKGWIIFGLGLAGYLAYRHNYISAAMAVAGVIAWMLFIVGVSLPAIYYNKLNRAVDWNRWDEVLNLVNKLEANRKINFIKIPEVELARNRAKALAGLGRIEEALAGYQKYENAPGCPSWLHKAFVAGIYDTAKQYDKAIEYNLLSMAEKENAAMHVDLAYRYAKYKRDVGAAREALNEAEKAVLAEHAKPYLLRTRGLVCYLEGKYSEARGAFEAAIEYMERTRNQAFREGNISVTKAHLSCVLAKQGELDLAKKHFAEAKGYLNATDEKDILDECRAAGVV